VKEQTASERTIKQCVEELRNNLATEEEHVSVVTDALAEAHSIRDRLAIEKEGIVFKSSRLP
jgi:hypothetical protein